MRFVIIEVRHDVGSIVAVEFAEPSDAYRYFESNMNAESTNYEYDTTFALKDDAGNYYVLAQSPVNRLLYKWALEAGRVELAHGTRPVSESELATLG